VSGSVAAPPRQAESLIGQLEPRWHVQPYATHDAATEVAALAASAGLVLDPWQRLVLPGLVGFNGTARNGAPAWAAGDAVVICPRQNGKSALIEARILAGLFLFDEPLIVYTAHEARTAKEIMRRVEQLVMGTPRLRRMVKDDRFTWSHGDEGVELKSGQRCLFKTRTKGAGRGFSGDCVIFDEAMKGLGDDEMSALGPTMLAIPNPQMIFAGSAGNMDAVTLARVVKAGRSTPSPDRMLYVDYCVDENDYDVDDERLWAQANPNLGRRLSLDVLRKLRRNLGPDAFARECMGVGTYPILDDDEESRLIPASTWRARLDAGADVVDPVAFGVAVARNRKSAAIVAAWRDDAGLDVLDVIDYRPGSGWVSERLRELEQRWAYCAAVVDGGGPTGTLLPDFDRDRVEVNIVGLPEYATGCGALYDDTQDPAGRIRHRGHPALDSAVAGAEQRWVGDRWVLSRKGDADICPLEAGTLALYGLRLWLDAREGFHIW
jgi:hypothetical protein